VFNIFSWSSDTDRLQEFGNSKPKVIVTHFRKMPIGEEKVEKILNGIMGERYKFKLMRQKSPLLDLLDRVVCIASSSVMLQYCRHQQPHVRKDFML
jgi:hypothetical protein